ncbi:MAG: hypothetical protein EOR63_32300 [Mesorhizobium sp.]|nr:MAG: hypothetical protein EOR63_32300 [Mesorhizobium sp.]
MSKSEYVVGGPSIDPEGLAEYRRLLDVAYRNGEAHGSQMDWSDVQTALAKAVSTLGGEAAAFMEDSESDEGLEDGVKIVFAEGTEVTAEVWSAALLLLAYRFPDSVEWEDVDSAWEALHREPEASPAP